MPPIKLYDQGKLNEEALRLFCHNTRTPQMVEADIKAIASSKVLRPMVFTVMPSFCVVPLLFCALQSDPQPAVDGEGPSGP